jgi:hypothetical protein
MLQQKKGVFDPSANLLHPQPCPSYVGTAFVCGLDSFPTPIERVLHAKPSLWLGQQDFESDLDLLMQ